MVAAFSRGYQLVVEPCDRVDFFDKPGYRNIRGLHNQLSHLLKQKECVNVIINTISKDLKTLLNHKVLEINLNSYLV